MTEPIVELQNVICAYGSTPILDDVTFSLCRGQFAGVLGPSGAGKTTLLKTILGLVKPTDGAVYVNGKAVSEQSGQRIGYVPQVESVDWNFPLTVEQAVIMGRTTRMGWLPWPSKSDLTLPFYIMDPP